MTIEIYPIHLYIPNNFEDKTKPFIHLYKWTKKRSEDAKIINKNSAIVKHCIKDKTIILHKAASPELRKELDALGIDCVIPSVTNNELLSLIVISKDKYIPNNSKAAVHINYSSTDKMLFDLISKQMTIVLSRLRPYEKLQIDYQKSLEVAKQASIYKAFAEFTKKIHHEIKNPLVGLSSFTGGLNKRFNRTDFNKKEESDLFFRDLKKFFKIAQDTVMQVDRVTNVMSRYSYISDENKFKLKDEHEEKKAVNVNEIIEDTFQLIHAFRIEKKVHVELSLDIKIPNIYANPTQVNQTILNIILNAIQAMEKGGEVVIKTSASKYQTKSGQTREGVRIDVSDNGKGMTEEEVEHMFDPFFTTKFDGLGLGLSIVFGVIDDHDGMIDVESAIGKGTTFTIYLPLLDNV